MPPTETEGPHSGQDPAQEARRLLATLDGTETSSEPVSPADVEAALEALKAALAWTPERGREWGPLVADLARAARLLQEAQESAAARSWVSLGAGRLAIGHRPGLKSLPTLALEGVSTLVTLLSESEGAEELGRAVSAHGVEWVWFPMPDGDPPDPERDAEAMEVLDRLVELLRQGQRVFIHCSAGIHRTGMFTYALLRRAGRSPEEAAAELELLRPVTGAGVGEERLDWGDRLARVGLDPG